MVGIEVVAVGLLSTHFQPFHRDCLNVCSQANRTFGHFEVNDLSLANMLSPFALLGVRLRTDDESQIYVDCAQGS
jgi:hypothetical protein